jgi:hypothetical protein
MILEKSIFLIASIYFWLLFGGISDTISCDLKKLFLNPYFRHFTAIISIFLLFVIIDKNKEGAFEIWKNTLILYILYVLFTKSKFYFSIPIIILVLIDQTFNSETLNLKEKYKNINEDKNVYETIDKYNNYRNYIHYIIIFLIITGFIHYYFRQKNKFKNKFSLFKFIFDINCKKNNIQLNADSLLIK